jgi:CO dehydrogenase/acetyl-CoA synthase epsilon subunit
MSDLNCCIRRLVDFVLQSIEDGLNDPSAALEYFSEADHALRIVGKILKKDDQVRHASLMLIGLFDISFVQSAKDSPSDLRAGVETPLKKIEYARTLFDDRPST